jgi:esterase/lipase superfamily enzyme
MLSRIATRRSRRQIGAMKNIAFAAAFATLLGACANAPSDLLTPVTATVEGASTVDMIVATTRRPAADPGELYTGERGGGLTYTNIVVSIPPDRARKPGEVNLPARVPGDPATAFVARRVAQVGQADFDRWVRARAASLPKRRALVFVHGYNNRFDDAVFRFAQLVHDTNAEVVPVLFTWPSRASVLAYGYDRESAGLSRDALEEVLVRLSRDPAVAEIDILAHSMGNWLLMETLRQMAIRDRRLPAKISDVMLAAPDIDVDQFDNDIADMGAPRPRFTLFASKDDRALALSGWIWGSDARLGAIDPAAEPYRSRLAKDNVTVYDLSQVQSDDRVNHNKFVKSSEMVQIVADRFAAGESLDDTHEGLGDQMLETAAKGVGAAAVSVETSETLGAQGSPRR